MSRGRSLGPADEAHGVPAVRRSPLPLGSYPSGSPACQGGESSPIGSDIPLPLCRFLLTVVVLSCIKLAPHRQQGLVSLLLLLLQLVPVSRSHPFCNAGGLDRPVCTVRRHCSVDAPPDAGCQSHTPEENSSHRAPWSPGVTPTRIYESYYGHAKTLLCVCDWPKLN